MNVSKSRRLRALLFPPVATPKDVVEYQIAANFEQRPGIFEILIRAVGSVVAVNVDQIENILFFRAIVAIQRMTWEFPSKKYRHTLYIRFSSSSFAIWVVVLEFCAVELPVPPIADRECPQTRARDPAPLEGNRRAKYQSPRSSSRPSTDRRDGARLDWRSDILAVLGRRHVTFHVPSSVVQVILKLHENIPTFERDFCERAYNHNTVVSEPRLNSI